MYTSTYSSSPVRTSTFDTTPTNYQFEPNYGRHYQSSNNINNNDINTMNNRNIPLNRNTGGYSHSASSLTSLALHTPTLPRKFTNNYDNSPYNTNRYQSTDYSPSYRTYGNDNEAFRSNSSRYDLNGNARAHSHNDLYTDYNRCQSALSNLRYNQQRQQQQDVGRYRYNDYDDDLIVKSTDLPATYEQDMINIVRTAFQKYEITNQRELAGYLKRAADRTFAPCWHCIVGRQFSSYVTHEMNGFIYFTKGPLSILLFKSGA